MRILEQVEVMMKIALKLSYNRWNAVIDIVLNAASTAAVPPSPTWSSRSTVAS
ncbi:MAG: hypothetical protein ABIZ80_12625 [Bryobacteraceae bacterium]